MNIQLSRALTILARAEALEHDLHAERAAMRAPSECSVLIRRGQARRDRELGDFYVDGIGDLP